jgi:hypothetical protein
MTRLNPMTVACLLSSLQMKIASFSHEKLQQAANISHIYAKCCLVWFDLFYLTFFLYFFKTYIIFFALQHSTILICSYDACLLALQSTELMIFLPPHSRL